jgi:hypothetical protein
MLLIRVAIAEREFDERKVTGHECDLSSGRCATSEQCNSPNHLPSRMTYPQVLILTFPVR